MSASLSAAASLSTGTGVLAAATSATQATLTATWDLPVFIRAGTAAWTASNAASFTPAIPAGTNGQDVLILVIQRSDNSAPTAPGGIWKNIASLSGVNSSTTILSTYVYWGVAAGAYGALTSTTATAITYGTSTVVRGGAMYAFRNVDTSNPFAAENDGTVGYTRLNNAHHAAGSSSTTTVTNMVVNQPNVLAVIIASVYALRATATVTPSTWATPNLQSTALGNDATLTISNEQFTAAGSDLQSPVLNFATTTTAGVSTGFLFALQGKVTATLQATGFLTPPVYASAALRTTALLIPAVQFTGTAALNAASSLTTVTQIAGRCTTTATTAVTAHGNPSSSPLLAAIASLATACRVANGASGSATASLTAAVLPFPRGRVSWVELELPQAGGGPITASLLATASLTAIPLLISASLSASTSIATKQAVATAARQSLASDNFNRADLGDLGANWTVANSGSNHFTIASNQAVPSGIAGLDNTSYYTAVAFPANQYSRAQIYSSGNASTLSVGPGLAVRSSGTTDATSGAYVFTINRAASNNATLWRASLTTSPIFASFTEAFTDGDVFELSIIGSVLTVKHGDNVIVTYSDNTLTSGAPGIYFSTADNGSGAIDNWDGGATPASASLLASALLTGNLKSASCSASGSLTTRVAVSAAATLSSAASVATAQGVIAVGGTRITLATDDFNRPDETPLAGNWTTASGFTAMRLQSNQVTGNTGLSDNGAYYNAVAWPNDQYSQAQIVTLGSMDAGMLLRVSTTAKTAYLFTHGGSALDVSKFVAGTYTVLTSDFSDPAWVAGDTLRLSITGTTLSYDHNALIAEAVVTDSTISSGNAGISEFTGGSAFWDNWQGGVFLSAASLTATASLTAGTGKSASCSASGSLTTKQGVGPTPQIVFATDDFNRVDGPTLGANWTPEETSPTNRQFVITSNTARPVTTANDCDEYYTGVTFPNDQYSRAKLFIQSVLGDNSGIGLSVRESGGDIHGGTGNGYFFRTDHASGPTGAFFKSIVGVTTDIGSTPNEAWIDGDTWTFTAKDSIVSITHISRIVVQTSDSSLTSGSPGLSYSSTATNLPWIDNWEGGTPSTGPVLSASATLTAGTGKSASLVASTSLTAGVAIGCTVALQATVSLTTRQGVGTTPQTSLATDNFNRANGDLGASWTDLSALGAKMQIASNAVDLIGTGPLDKGAYYSARTWPNNQYSKAQLSSTDTTAPGDGSGPGLGVRQSGTGEITDGVLYRLIVQHSSSRNVFVSKYISGVNTDLGFWTQAWSDGDTWEFDASGNLLIVRYLTGNAFVASITDSSVSTGAPGLQFSSGSVTTASGDDWEGGVITNGPVLLAQASLTAVPTGTITSSAALSVTTSLSTTQAVAASANPFATGSLATSHAVSRAATCSDTASLTSTVAVAATSTLSATTSLSVAGAVVDTAACSSTGSLSSTIAVAARASPSALGSLSTISAVASSASASATGSLATASAVAASATASDASTLATTQAIVDTATLSDSTSLSTTGRPSVSVTLSTVVAITTRQGVSPQGGTYPMARDSFGRADSTGSGANWSTVITQQAFNISASTAVPASPTGVDSCQYWNAIAFPNDQYSKAALSVVGTNGGGRGPGVLVRTDTSSQTFYRFVVDHAGSTNVTVEKELSSAVTVLGTATLAWTDGDVWEIDVQGQNLKGLHSGSVIVATTDSSISQGSPGIVFSTDETSASIDDWEGGAITNGPVLLAQASLAAVPTGTVVSSASLTAVASLSTTQTVAASASTSANGALTTSHAVSRAASCSSTASLASTVAVAATSTLSDTTSLSVAGAIQCAATCSSSGSLISAVAVAAGVSPAALASISTTQSVAATGSVSATGSLTNTSAVSASATASNSVSLGTTQAVATSATTSDSSSLSSSSTSTVTASCSSTGSITSSVAVAASSSLTDIVTLTSTQALAATATTSSTVALSTAVAVSSSAVLNVSSSLATTQAVALSVALSDSVSAATTQAVATSASSSDSAILSPSLGANASGSSSGTLTSSVAVVATQSTSDAATTSTISAVAVAATLSDTSSLVVAGAIAASAALTANTSTTTTQGVSAAATASATATLSESPVVTATANLTATTSLLATGGSSVSVSVSSSVSLATTITIATAVTLSASPTVTTAQAVATVATASDSTGITTNAGFFATLNAFVALTTTTAVAATVTTSASGSLSLVIQFTAMASLTATASVSTGQQVVATESLTSTVAVSTAQAVATSATTSDSTSLTTTGAPVSTASLTATTSLAATDAVAASASLSDAVSLATTQAVSAAATASASGSLTSQLSFTAALTTSASLVTTQAVATTVTTSAAASLSAADAVAASAALPAIVSMQPNGAGTGQASLSATSSVTTTVAVSSGATSSDSTSLSTVIAVAASAATSSTVSLLAAGSPSASESLSSTASLTAVGNASFSALLVAIASLSATAISPANAACTDNVSLATAQAVSTQASAASSVAIFVTTNPTSSATLTASVSLTTTLAVATDAELTSTSACSVVALAVVTASLSATVNLLFAVAVAARTTMAAQVSGLFLIVFVVSDLSATTSLTAEGTTTDFVGEAALTAVVSLSVFAHVMAPPWRTTLHGAAVTPLGGFRGISVTPSGSFSVSSSKRPTLAGV